jgi:hypothetical protein
MCKHSLYSLALISFSIASHAVAIPMDADRAGWDAIQNVVLHKEVVMVQGGGFDKDVAKVLAVTTMDKCSDGLACNKDDTQNVVIGDMHIYANQSVGDWFVQDSPGTLQLLLVWLIILASVVFLLYRKSASAK